MSVTLSTQPPQTPGIRPPSQQATPTTPTTPAPAEPPTQNQPPAAPEDQATISPELQGPPPSGDASSVANEPGQVAFVDGVRRVGTPMEKVPLRTVATTTQGAGGTVSNNPAETFSFQRTFGLLAAAFCCTTVGTPSRCIEPMSKSLKQDFSLDATDARDPVSKSLAEKQNAANQPARSQDDPQGPTTEAPAYQPPTLQVSQRLRRY